ncbi:MAG TPA: flagellar assembly peptidoglycan hydrolase FlgJ [Methylotenera sp.]|nr:flagellar assembly peptidoglycan hydrolase FlgJ [Methylotenera sp.]HPH04961.1 flagellar assembly peptidoglycan hydrolase FlgJ [Methylotenera sp.]HPN00223.1 flagellar assembly peptidoglycan hydrolase FlgJ [Methylotenera sp.]
MVNGTDLSGKIAIDANGLSSLKQAAKENSPEAIKEVAKQFEAIFMNMMLKSMREASSSEDNPFDNEQSRTFTAMLDQQLSSNLSSKGLGLAEVLARQLSKTDHLSNMATSVDDTDAKLSSDKNLPTNTHSNLFNANPIISNPLAVASKVETNKSSESSVAAFQAKMATHAQEASRSTGIPANLMLGQAALESGWGKREIKSSDGTNSHNLFGIKATGNWDGKVVETMTTEYINGIKQKRIEKFRAYDSYADSFKDFAQLMQNNPRYEKVLSNVHDTQAYAKAMQQSGYATDPQYASKLANVIDKVSSL